MKINYNFLLLIKILIKLFVLKKIEKFSYFDQSDFKNFNGF